MEKSKYSGTELNTFSLAKNWKNYFIHKIDNYIKGDVLEVGAGIGSNIEYMNFSSVKRWFCIEPDPENCNKIAEIVQKRPDTAKFNVVCGCLANIDKKLKFDCILYIEVLEHIKNDMEELKLASEYLNEAGSIIVISPSYQFLYSNFDKSIGHFRRYSKSDLLRIRPQGLLNFSSKYLDSVGFLASLMNKLLLKQDYPTKKQILLWDRVMIPLSSFFDKLFFHKFGKTILAIYRKGK